MTATPGYLQRPGRHQRHHRDDALHQRCVARGRAPTTATYTIADSDLGAILRVRETASNAGGETMVWSARYVGPVINAQAAAAVLTRGETALRNASGRRSRWRSCRCGRARASAAKPKAAPRSRCAGRRASRASSTPGPARPRSSAGATPPPCSKKVKLASGDAAPPRVDGREGARGGDPRPLVGVTPSHLDHRQSRPGGRARPSNPRRTTLRPPRRAESQVDRTGGVGDEPHVLDEDVQRALASSNAPSTIRAPRSSSMNDAAAPSRITSRTARRRVPWPRRRPAPRRPRRCARRAATG